MANISEKARKTAVIENMDVVVIGGGPGGIPAAVAAARRGCKTLLIERYGFMGGLATGGLMGPFFGYAALGHRKNRLLGGIPVEIVRELQKLNGAPNDKDIDWAAIRFYPEFLKHVADKLVVGSGSKLLLHSYAVDLAIKNNKVEAVIIESKSGRQAVKAGIFIDATGDGDIAFLGGCPFSKGRKADGRTQSLGTKFRIGGVRRMTKAEHEEGRRIANKAIDEKKLPAFHAFYGEISEQGITLRADEITPTATRCAGDGTNVYDLTRAEVKIRRDTLAIVDFYRRNVRGYENCYLMETPAQMGVRETRQIIGDYILTGQDVLQSRKFDDCIARGCWFLDIHCPLGFYCSDTIMRTISHVCDKNCKVKPDCLMKRKYRDQLYDTLWPEDKGVETYYDIPYRCLVPQKLDNLLISGRCISADHGGMASARVIGTCFAIGEAAGLAAWLSLKTRKPPRQLEVARLQMELKRNGVPL
jgi:hypothetical protein